MTSSFFNCVAGYVTKIPGGGSSPYYRVPGLSDIKGSDGAVHIVGVQRSPSTSYAAVDCLDGFKAIVAMGAKFEPITISLRIFLGDQVTQTSSAWAQVAKWFGQNRVGGSNSKPVFVVEGKAGRMATPVYIMALQNSPPDDSNIMQVSISGIKASPSPRS